MAWWWLVRFVVAVIVAVALAPKPPEQSSARPKTLADFDLPTAEDGRRIPVVFGTVHFQSPNNIWYGDLSSKAIWSD